jgi:hypothetical protein
MLYSEIIAVFSQIRTKHINTLCGQNVDLNVKLAVHNDHWTLMDLLGSTPWRCLGVWRYSSKHSQPRCYMLACGQHYDRAALSPVPTTQQARCTAQAVWSLCRRQNPLPADSPFFSSLRLVTTLTELLIHVVSAVTVPLVCDIVWSWKRNCACLLEQPGVSAVTDLGNMRARFW